MSRRSTTRGRRPARRRPASPSAARAEPPPPLPGWPDRRSQLAAIVEHSNDAIFSRTFDGRIATWNRAAERIFGYSAAEMIGRSSDVLLAPGTRDEYRRVIARLRRGRPVEGIETLRRRRDGTLIHVALTLSPIRDSARRLIGFSTIARDVSERRRLSDEVARRERDLADIFEQASVGLILVSPEGDILRANPAFLATAGAHADQVIGRPLARWLAWPDDDSLRAALAGRGTLLNVSGELRNARGRTRHVLIDADGRWEDGRLAYSRWFIRDISRRRQLEQEVLAISDRERRGFALELHDGLGQQLGGIAYLANVLRETLAQQAGPGPELANRIFSLTRRAIADARRMARGLSPIREEPEGLMAALRELASQVTATHGVDCRFRLRAPVPVEHPTLAAHLFRIAQEAVNNALKHGHPRRIVITLGAGPTGLRLTVADDGAGIRPLSPGRSGIGLRLMQYRASLIRSRLQVLARRPRGTRVVCTVPPAPPSQ